MAYPCGRHAPLAGDPRMTNRRWFLQQCGVGLGAIALNGLVGDESLAGSTDPLAAKSSHHPARAKNVILLFMGGGPSQLEMWDYKPELQRLNGTLRPAEVLEGYRSAFINPNSKLLGPKFKFTECGDNGLHVSELLPHTRKVLDELCVVRSGVTDAFNHVPAQLFMQSGSQQFGRPCLGSWTTYGLGSESRNLPACVVFNSGSKGPSAGAANWGSGFLPTVYSGVEFRSTGDPVLYLSSPDGVTDAVQRKSIDTVNTLNRRQLDLVGDPEIATRINSYEMACRMQASAPPRRLTWRANHARRSPCTASTRRSRRSQRTASSPGGWWSRECALLSSSMSRGTSTAESRHSCPRTAATPIRRTRRW